ncbi:hypothetical protein GGQ02_002951 [Salinibacter ruber]|nr:hypothetical protein [Salinibacter ruber]
MPASAHLEMSDDSSSAIAPMIVKMAFPIGLSVSMLPYALTKRMPR